MKLNLSLNLCDKNGTAEIKKYCEFKDFFNKLKPYIKTGIYDDPILEVFLKLNLNLMEKSITQL